MTKESDDRTQHRTLSKNIFSLIMHCPTALRLFAIHKLIKIKINALITSSSQKNQLILLRFHHKKNFIYELKHKISNKVNNNHTS